MLCTAIADPSVNSSVLQVGNAVSAISHVTLDCLLPDNYQDVSFQPVASRVLGDLDEEDLEELFDDAAEGSALEDNWGEAMEVNTVICLLSSSTLIQPTHPLFQIINLHPLLPLLQVIQASEALLPQERPSEDDLLQVRATRPTMTLASLVMESSTLQVGSTAFRLRSTIGQRLCSTTSCSLVSTDSKPPAPLDSAPPTNTDYSRPPPIESRLPPPRDSCPPPLGEATS